MGIVGQDKKRAFNGEVMGMNVGTCLLQNGIRTMNNNHYYLPFSVQLTSQCGCHFTLA
jgi:hypothetical protein